MPARVVVVRDDPEALEEIMHALRAAGHLAVGFTDPLAALTALEAARTVQVLVTQADFAPGRPNGIALARLARLKRPGTRVALMALPGYEVHAAGLAEYLPMPVGIDVVVATIGRLLAEADQDPD